MQKKILKIFTLFLLFFAFILPSWIYLKNYYNFFITNSMFSLVASHFKLGVQDTSITGREVLFHIKNAIPLRDIHGKSHDFEMDVSVDMEAVTFNVPMTLALLLAIVLSAKLSKEQRWDILTTGIALLFLLHLISMATFALCVIEQTQQINPYVRFYLTQHWMPGDYIYNVKDFLVNYAARFEPFLIGLYAWWRVKGNKKTILQEEVSPLSTRGYRP